MSLGSKFQLPQTNVNSSSIMMYPDNVGPDYKFRFGKTLVSYVANHVTGETVSCSYFVDIKGKNRENRSSCSGKSGKFGKTFILHVANHVTREERLFFALTFDIKGKNWENLA